MRLSAGLRRRAIALVLLLALAGPSAALVGPAWADESGPATSAGSGSIVKQVNQGFALLFMVFKLAELLGSLDLPPQGGPPDPQWGSHPGPLPVVTPPADLPAVDAPVCAPVPG